MKSKVLTSVSVAVYSASRAYFFAIAGALAAVDVAVASIIAKASGASTGNGVQYFKKNNIRNAHSGESNNFIIETK